MWATLHTVPSLPLPVWAPELHSQWECGHLATHSQWKWTAVWASGPHSQREWMTVVFGTSPAGRVRAGLSAPKRPKVAPKRANVLATCSPGQGDPNITMGEAHCPPMSFVLPFVRLGREPLSTTLVSVGVWASGHHSEWECDHSVGLQPPL